MILSMIAKKKYLEVFGIFLSSFHSTGSKMKIQMF